MLIVTMAANGERFEQVLACLGCENIAPVNDYHFIASDSAGETTITTLNDYSRWTEPAFALLSRLATLHPRDLRAPEPGTHLRSTIYLGRNFETARPIERLDARIVEGSLHASMEDEFGMRRGRQAARKRYAHPLDMLEHAARLALWLVDAEPLIPPPLTEVPIRHDDNGGGPPYVLATDIPDFPRRFFEQRRLGCAVPMPGAYYASDWWRFIGGRP